MAFSFEKNGDFLFLRKIPRIRVEGVSVILSIPCFTKREKHSITFNFLE